MAEGEASPGEALCSVFNGVQREFAAEFVAKKGIV